MTHPALEVRGLGKQYRIGSPEQYTTLRDRIAKLVRRSPGAERSPLVADVRSAEDPEYIWALRDLSFDVQVGEVVGIIGRNGAGKSTLLKVLSRITPPTTGQADVFGRVGSLLEVGTGFHPELTGRENILLNGAILGMPRSQIVRKFDEIVAFAEVERFIHTPVKHYSSGMYLRLAFAVAAHLEPDILIVDEVLAVGDAVFQKKCLGKMGEVASAGRTVLFVSHNMTAVQSLCGRAIWLHLGRIEADGPARSIVSQYFKTSFTITTERTWDDPGTAPGNESVRLRRVAVRPLDDESGGIITVRTPVLMEFEYWNLEPEARLNLSLHVFNEEEVMLFNTGPVRERAWNGRPLPAGLYRSTCLIPGDFLNDGRHRVQLLVVKNQRFTIFRDEAVLVFDVHDSGEDRGGWHGKWPGALRPHLDWSTELLSPSDEPLIIRR